MIFATMKILLTTTLTILCLLTATAQDIIVKKDGDTLRVYDLKINAKFITYREKPGGNAPSKRIGKAKVLSVKKRNGKSITISKPDPKPANVSEVVSRHIETPTKASAEKPIDKQHKKLNETSREKPKGEVKRAVAVENPSLVGEYNKSHNGYDDKKQKNSKATCAVAIMGVTTGSILANEDVKIEFSECRRGSDASVQYNIFVQNKTDKIIYLDLENCFRIYNDGTFKPYYSGREIRQNKKSNTKITFSNKTATSYSRHTRRKKANTYGSTYTLDDSKQTSQVVKEKKIIAIPPKGKVALPPRVSLDEYDEIIEEYDVFCTTLQKKQYPLHNGQVVNIDETQTPYKNSFIITYSPNKNFETYSTAKFGLYLKQLIGLGKKISKFNERLIDGYDRYTICGEIYLK